VGGTTVIVPTLRPDQYLDRCLASVAEQAAEIVVVDNASHGHYAATIAERYGARLIRLEQNLGFAASVNVGARAAREDHVALLNDDAFAGPDWLAGSEKVLEDDSVGAVVPKLLFAWRRGVIRLEDPVSFVPGDWRPHGRKVISVTVGTYDATRDIHPFGSHSHDDDGFWTTAATTIVVPLVEDGDGEVRVNGEPVAVEASFDLVNNAGSYLHAGGWCGDIGYAERDDGSFDTPVDRFAACGAALVTRRETWQRLGGMAEEFHHYYEDTDWSWRARLAGLRIRYDPALEVRHVHAQTSHEGSDLWQFFVARNRVLCFARNAPRRVVARMLTEMPPLPEGVAKSLARRLPAAMLHRARRGSATEEARERIWARWAGVNTPA
jgi:GT2 family glycosyltransferase